MCRLRAISRSRKRYVSAFEWRSAWRESCKKDYNLFPVRQLCTPIPAPNRVCKDCVKLFQKPLGLVSSEGTGKLSTGYRQRFIDNDKGFRPVAGQLALINAGRPRQRFHRQWLDGDAPLGTTCPGYTTTANRHPTPPGPPAHHSRQARSLMPRVDCSSSLAVERAMPSSTELIMIEITRLDPP